MFEVSAEFKVFLTPSLAAVVVTTETEALPVAM